MMDWVVRHGATVLIFAGGSFGRFCFHFRAACEWRT